MKIKKSIILGITALSLGTVGVISKPMATQAISIYNATNPFWRHGHWVTLEKNVRILKIRNTYPRAYSYQVASYIAKRGSHYKLEHWGVDYSWVLQSGRFNSGSHYTYVVSAKGHSWFKFGIHNYPTYRTLKTNGFYFDKYIPGFLTAGNTAKVYTTPEDASSQNGTSYELTSIYKEMYIKWNNGNNDDILKINYDGNIYYYNDKDGVFQPYNSFRDGNGISSPYSPNSKSKIYLKHGTNIYNGTRWDQVTTYKGGLLISKSYKFKNDHWVKIY